MHNDSFLGEVDNVVALFNDELLAIERELNKIHDIEAGRRSAGRFPLGKKFLINRGRFADRLMKILETKLGRLDD